MNSSRGMGDTMAWLGTVAGGVWLSMKVAQWMTGWAGAAASGRSTPVREVVKEAMTERQADNSPIVHAFQEALDAEQAGVTAG